MKSINTITTPAMAESLHLIAAALNLTKDQRNLYENVNDLGIGDRFKAWHRFIDETLAPAFVVGQPIRLVKAATGAGATISARSVDNGNLFVREDFFGKCELVYIGNMRDDVFATYSDKMTMCEMIFLLADAIRKGDPEFTFPSENEFVDLREAQFVAEERNDKTA